MIICLINRSAEYDEDGYRIGLKWIDENKQLRFKNLFDTKDNLFRFINLTFYTTYGKKIARCYVSIRDKTFPPDSRNPYDKDRIELNWWDDSSKESWGKIGEFIENLCNGGLE